MLEKLQPIPQLSIPCMGAPKLRSRSLRSLTADSSPNVEGTDQEPCPVNGTSVVEIIGLVDEDDGWVCYGAPCAREDKYGSVTYGATCPLG